ncbi:hypothetical protein [Photorhabdus viridis]
MPFGQIDGVYFIPWFCLLLAYVSKLGTILSGGNNSRVMLSICLEK